jgi:hypothetical protein
LRGRGDGQPAAGVEQSTGSFGAPSPRLALARVGAKVRTVNAKFSAAPPPLGNLGQSIRRSWGR